MTTLKPVVFFPKSLKIRTWALPKELAEEEGEREREDHWWIICLGELPSTRLKFFLHSHSSEKRRCLNFLKRKYLPSKSTGALVSLTVVEVGSLFFGRVKLEHQAGRTCGSYCYLLQARKDHTTRLLFKPFSRSLVMDDMTGHGRNLRRVLRCERDLRAQSLEASSSTETFQPS